MTEILARVEGTLGRITLNRPRALNALTHQMVRSIAAALTQWATDDAVHAILLDGAGDRGLCAGGDIRSLYDAAIARDMSVPAAFFRDEYRLNAQIAHYPKPYVALMDGIVMGGGVGLASHGSFRVVTERTRLAMPETGIGFMPDVGGTWLLAHAPDNLGLHAALTAAPMDAARAIACGMADFQVPSSSLPVLATELAKCRTSSEIRACIGSHAATPSPDGAGAPAWCRTCYAHDSVEQIVQALAQHDEPDAREAAATISRKSPLSLKIALRAIREAPSLGSLDACLEREYRLAMFFMATRDFREGVRAAIVDKDRNPSWAPGDLAGVTDAMVNEAFAFEVPEGLGLAATSAKNGHTPDGGR